MNRFIHRLTPILCLLLAPLPTVLDGRELDVDQLPIEWIELFEGLRSRLPLQAAFLESRALPFRSRAVELEGTLRVDAEAGVSLNYAGESSSITNLIDAEGMATRQNEDPWRPLPDRPEIRALHQAIGALLTLDLAALGASYAMDGVMMNGLWVLELSPKPGVETGRLKGLTIQGGPDRISGIEAHLGRDRGITIEIVEDATRVTFQPEDYARYFR